MAPWHCSALRPARYAASDERALAVDTASRRPPPPSGPTAAERPAELEGPPAAERPAEPAGPPAAEGAAGPSGLSILHAAAHTAGAAISTAIAASARWCLTAWKLPMGTPNWRRSLT